MFAALAKYFMTSFSSPFIDCILWKTENECGITIDHWFGNLEQFRGPTSRYASLHQILWPMSRYSDLKQLWVLRFISIPRCRFSNLRSIVIPRVRSSISISVWRTEPSLSQLNVNLWTDISVSRYRIWGKSDDRPISKSTRSFRNRNIGLENKVNLKTQIESTYKYIVHGYIVRKSKFIEVFRPDLLQQLFLQTTI